MKNRKVMFLIDKTPETIDCDISERPSLRAAAKELQNWCYICGRFPADSEKKFEKEHVIPKELFRPRKPKEYPAVLWACDPCHDKKTLDEQYVIAQFVLCSDYDQKSVKDRFNETLKDYASGHFQRMHEKILANSAPAEVYSRGGLFLGIGQRSSIPGGRIRPFLSTIGKGLWVRHSLMPFNWLQYDFLVTIKQVTVPPGPNETLLISYL